MERLKKLWHDGVGAEVICISKLFGPIFVANLTQLGMTITDNIFVAQLGTNELAGATLGNTLAWSSLYMCMGFTYAIDSLVSQAYGAGNHRLAGVLFQTALFCVTFLAIPVAIIWLFAEEILILLHQPAEIAHLSAKFIRWLIPSIWPISYLSVVQRVLQSQGHVSSGLIAGIISFFFNIVANYVLIFTVGLGFEGAPLATTLSRFVLLIATCAHAFGWKKHHKEMWSGWTLEAISKKRLTIFLKFGFFAMLTIASEVWGFEAMALIAGGLGSAQTLDIHVVCLNVLLVSYILPLALGIASGTRVGNLLGQGSSAQAKFSARVSLVWISVLMSINATIIVAFRNQIPLIYSSDQVVIDGASTLLWLAGLATLFDGVQVMCTSLLRGAGKPNIGALANVVGYGLIAIPLSFITAYALGWGVFGIWGSLAFALLIVMIMMAIFVTRIDWEKEAELAQERSEVGKYNTVEGTNNDAFELEDQIASEDPVIEMLGSTQLDSSLEEPK